MKCEQCGLTVLAGSVVCPNCGAPVGKTGSVQEVIPDTEPIAEVSTEPQPVVNLNESQVPEPVKEVVDDVVDTDTISVPLDSDMTASVASSQAGIPIITEVLEEGATQVTSNASTPISDLPVEEVNVSFSLNENDHTWTDEEPEEEKKEEGLQPIVKIEEPKKIFSKGKPDLLKGENELTLEEQIAYEERKKYQEQRKAKMIQIINRIALLVVIAVVFILLYLFVLKPMFTPKDTTVSYEYGGYTFHIDQNYTVSKTEVGFDIITEDHEGTLSVSIEEGSYESYENAYASNVETFVQKMKNLYGEKNVKRVEKQTIDDKTFIMVTLAGEESCYIIYTKADSNQMVRAIYRSRDGILNHSRALAMMHSLKK